MGLFKVCIFIAACLTGVSALTEHIGDLNLLGDQRPSKDGTGDIASSTPGNMVEAEVHTISDVRATGPSLQRFLRGRVVTPFVNSQSLDNRTHRLEFQPELGQRQEVSVVAAVERVAKHLALLSGRSHTLCASEIYAGLRRSISALNFAATHSSLLESDLHAILSFCCAANSEMEARHVRRPLYFA